MRSHIPFLRSVTVKHDRVERPHTYPYSLPAIQGLDGLSFSAVTYFVGENGSGKSTILEALAIVMGFNPEGGTRNFSFSTRASESDLHKVLRPVRSERRAKTGFFLRAESFFNVATEIENLDVLRSYGGRSLHEQSHGESFLSLVKNRFGPQALYILDEPEAALSPTSQLSLLVRMRELVEAGSQFIVATHAPIVLAYPNATIYHVHANGLSPISYDETEHVRLTRNFLNDRGRFLECLFAAEAADDGSPMGLVTI